MGTRGVAWRCLGSYARNGNPKVNPVMTDDDADSDLDEPLKLYNPSALPGPESIEAAADSMAEFNRLLWEVAKTVFIVVAMLLGFSMLVMAYYAAQFLATV